MEERFKLKKLYNIRYPQDIFDKTFYTALESNIHECRVREFGYCLNERGEDNGYVMLEIAGEDDPYVVTDSVGYEHFPVDKPIYETVQNCLMDMCRVSVFRMDNTFTPYSDIVCNIKDILTQQGYTVSSDGEAVLSYKIGMMLSVTSTETKYSFRVTRDQGCQVQVFLAPGYYRSKEEAVENANVPVIRFKDA